MMFSVSEIKKFLEVCATQGAQHAIIHTYKIIIITEFFFLMKINYKNVRV